MIDFGGWDMPVYYTGINEEHRAVRTACGVFDVSHMGQLVVRGPGAFAYLQAVLSNDLGRIPIGRAQYTLLPNEQGGIIDDLIAYRVAEDNVLLVVNAGNVAADREWLRAHLPAEDVTLIDRSDEYGMLAVQGPTSDAILAAVDGGAALAGVPAFGFTTVTLAGVACLAVRTGYTGEHGVEILVPAAETGAVWDALLAAGAEPCGLGARDTLRLEVCYPLHGNDISPTTDAIEAGLGWVCAKDKAYTGSDVHAATRAAGPARRLVPFRMQERAIPRAGMLVRDAAGVEIGVVTSGTLSPMLDAGVGMAYVRTAESEVGAAIVIDVRGKLRPATVAERPLYRPTATV
jgi:aminomethyltransferase